MVFDADKAWVLWPEYFDSSRTRAEGRRVAKHLAIPEPQMSMIIKAVEKLGLEWKLEEGKAYPGAWWNKQGSCLLRTTCPRPNCCPGRRGSAQDAKTTGLRASREACTISLTVFFNEARSAVLKGLYFLYQPLSCGNTVHRVDDRSRLGYRGFNVIEDDGVASIAIFTVSVSWSTSTMVMFTPEMPCRTLRR